MGLLRSLAWTITVALLCMGGSMEKSAARAEGSSTVARSKTPQPAMQWVDPRGPIRYPGMKTVVSVEGVQAPGYSFVNRCQKPSPWQAHWIWLKEETTGRPVACFRKELTLAAPPKQVHAWVSADIKYRLYINGKLVSRGPVDMGRDYAGGSTGRWFYDYRDLTPYFRKGSNVIAAEVCQQWPIGFTISRGHPGLLFEAEVTLPDGTHQTLKTDETWRGAPADYFINGEPQHYDAGKEPMGWRLPGFAETDWAKCRIVPDVWTPLIPSEIPPLMEVRYPVRRIERVQGGVQASPAQQPGQKIRVTSDGSFVVVFDRVLSGYPTLKVRGGKGAHIAIKTTRQATMVLGEGEQAYEFPFMDEIVPAITVEITHVAAPFEIEDIGAVFTAQPVAYRGEFACSDPKLNEIWKVSRWAVQICQQTHHLDSPNHQEPISDPGDYLIEAMVNYHAFAQPWLARQDLRKFAWLLEDEKYHNFHTSYSLGWLQMLMDYYDYTGDQELLRELAPTVYGLMEAYASWIGKNGIVSEAPNYMFMDWVTIGGFECHHPPAVIGQGYLTAFYCHGLDQASRMAQLLGDTARWREYLVRRGNIAAAFNRELWVPAKGLYRDGKPFQTSVQPYQWLPADKEIETFSPHVNLLAVLYDLAPQDRKQEIVSKVLAEAPLNTQPWFMHWVLPSIEHAGLFDTYGAPQMRRWNVVPDTRSFHEMWNGGDLSHGWCSTPLVQMSSRILGIRPTSPGFKTFEVDPRLCDLTWAKGRVPTPQGDILVSWSLGENRLEMEVVVPRGTEAMITLPVSGFVSAKILMNGKLLQDLPRVDVRHLPQAQVRAGRYSFVATGAMQNSP